MAIMLTTRIPAQERASGQVQALSEVDAQSESIPVLELTLEDRQRSRLAAMLPNGRAVAVILARGESMQHGDVLCGEGGEQVLVQAAPESLMLIRASNAFELMRIVYHLANRHVRAMLLPDSVLIEPDPVLAELVRRLGGTVEQTRQPFLPEGGAYSANTGGHSHSHSHHHHQHPSECGVELQDEAMGQIGEQLSIAAHARSKT
ncbi:Urease accessory protein UreE [Zwartia panacis]|jgi:urease accessory protein|uniref:Urease accessory protein UreE n=1 Tax=Zwartia panacis TaxID=2683345 RepID=UPI0025B58BB8|nr:Urease accessory protein UreE [Zwartia panacis]MDN4015485.1 Urease accessory protein UreE [Zwartia panacis]